MNDSDLEEELRTLRPTAPSPALENRIQQELAASGSHGRSGALVRPNQQSLLGRLWRDLIWAAAGATAAIAFLSFGRDPVSPVVSTPVAEPAMTEPAFTPQVSDAFVHAGATEELVGTVNSDDLIETTDGPVREVRYTYRERHAWTNPATGARVILEVPRDDIYLQPIALQ